MAEGGSKLSEEQIFEFLKILNVPVRMSDLKVPLREFIVRVFECFVRDLQIDINGHELRTWEAVNHIEDPGIYEEGIFLVLLAITVNHIMNPIGLDITIKDIVEPKPKRTKKILNYLLVFWNYYVQRCARFRAIQDSYEEEKKKIEDLLFENQSLDEKYEEMLNIIKNMQPSKEERSETVTAKQEKVSKLENESKAVSADYEALKAKETSLRDEISAADVRIVEAKQRIDELGQHIVSSPERINTEMQNLNDKIKAEDQKIKECENKIKAAKKKLQDLDECVLEDEKDAKLLNDLKESIKQLRESVGKIVSYHEKICEEEDKVKKLQMEVDRKEETKLEQEKKSAKLVLNSKKHIETIKEVLKMNLKQGDNLKKDLEYIKTTVSEIQESIDAESISILDIIEKLKEADAISKETKTRYRSKVQEILAGFNSDCDEVLKAIRKRFPYEFE